MDGVSVYPVYVCVCVCVCVCVWRERERERVGGAQNREQKSDRAERAGVPDVVREREREREGASDLLCMKMYTRSIKTSTQKYSVSIAPDVRSAYIIQLYMHTPSR